MKILYCLFLAIICGSAFAQEQQVVAGKLSGSANVVLKRDASDKWGIYIERAGNASAVQTNPVQIELYTDSAHISELQTGYDKVDKTSTGFTGTAILKAGNTTFHIVDQWDIHSAVLILHREIVLKGSGTQYKGFLSKATFESREKQTKADVRYFAPGMIYGSADHLTDVAIGGSEGGLATWIREDRLTAPLFGIHFRDGSAVTILDARPDGSTTKEDSRDLQVRTLVDERFRFGALGAEEKDGNLTYGFVWPGTEGAVTYKGKMYPGGQLHKWRRRYHPVEEGQKHQYAVSFRFDHSVKNYTDYYTKAWRWAWQELQPKVNPQDIELSRRSLVDMLGERVETHHGFTGIPYFRTAAKTNKPVVNMKTAMGFVGKALESANFLLQDADRGQSSKDAVHRELAEKIINSFMNKLSLSPPSGEAVMMETGEAVMVRPQDGKMYLRSFGDDLKSLMKAIKRERLAGRMHNDWLQWAKSFADWLLPQQQKAGGFPRGWALSGEIADASPQSSYTIIPFLMLMTELTGDPAYQKAAIKAADFCWNSTQSKGIFVGGTIDNPDVIDKEAGTLSTEAYLSIYESEHSKKWLDRARAAADYAETWIYIWNIPMPEDESDQNLPWKKGVSTVGLQLISTGHSLADVYMAFDVDEYAKLYKFSGDKHYYDVAKILLHNTKGMLALPGRTYDLAGPGWQQEHWSLAPMRGFGIHRGWLPWVSTSHLNGIFGLEEFDPALFKELSETK